MGRLQAIGSDRSAEPTAEMRGNASVSAAQVLLGASERPTPTVNTHCGSPSKEHGGGSSGGVDRLLFC